MSGINPSTKLSWEYVLDPFDLPIQVSVVEHRWDNKLGAWELAAVLVIPIEALDVESRQYLNALRARWQQPRLL